jgi:hypothetical protein
MEDVSDRISRITSDALAVPRLTSSVSGAEGSSAPPLASYESL